MTLLWIRARRVLLAVLLLFATVADALELRGGLVVETRDDSQPIVDLVEILEVGFVGHLRIRLSGTGAEGWIRVTDETELRRGPRCLLIAGEEIGFEDLLVGQTARVRQDPRTGRVLRLRILESPRADPSGRPAKRREAQGSVRASSNPVRNRS